MFMGKKLKKIAMGLTAVLAAGIIAGCGGGSSSDKQSAEKKQHKIGIVQLVEQGLRGWA